MGKIIGIYGVQRGLGATTIGQSLAKVIGESNSKVLYLELDYLNATFARKTAISNPDKNMEAFMEKAILEHRLDIQKYILKNSEIGDGKRFSWIPNNMEMLTFSNDFAEKNFPRFETNVETKVEKFINDFISKLKTLDYDFVILQLPNQIENIFGLPILSKCDSVVSVLTGNPIVLSKYKDITNVFKKADFQYKDWVHVFNLCSHEIDEEDYKMLMDFDVATCIPYDSERAEIEFSLIPGSETIDEYIKIIARKLGCFIRNEQNGFRFFKSK
ncbi:AAA family ATPase [Bacillus sp. ISL-8]|nr:AAA family ATPase [Bacillus sp. ISL-8]